MIISHANRLIFVKTRKTAGTSIELALRSICGPADIITPVGADEALAESIGVGGPQNTRLPLHRMDLRDARRLLLSRRAPVYYNHMPAQRIRRLVGASTWDDYLTVAVERNPWDRAISLFYFHLRQDGGRAFESLTPFLRHARDNRPKLLANWWLYSRREVVLVDKVMRYEDLDVELKSLWSTLAADPRELPRAKGEYRLDRRPYSEVMNTEDRDIVASVCRAEIEHFGYEF